MTITLNNKDEIKNAFKQYGQANYAIIDKVTKICYAIGKTRKELIKDLHESNNFNDLDFKNFCVAILSDRDYISIAAGNDNKVKCDYSIFIDITD